MIKRITKIFLLFITITLLFSCRNTSGSYKIEFLNELKSSSDSSFLMDYKEKHNISIHGYLWSLQMVYDIELADIVATNFVEVRPDMDYDENEKKAAKLFLDTYYFVNAEKLSTFFPVESVKTTHRLLFKNEIYITKYDTKEDQKNNTYHVFLYLFESGYLFLKNYDFYNKGEQQTPIAYS